MAIPAASSTLSPVMQEGMGSGISASALHSPIGSLDPILKPQRIAVVGASRTPNTIGHRIVSNLVRCGFSGAVYPVNPRAVAVHALPAWPSILELPHTPDVAIISVPKERVLEVAEESGRRGVRALVVVSAGFREIGGEGIERERALVAIARRHGMRLVGPNCMGMINTDPAISMNATFASPMPPFGRAAFVSQSGALGVSVLDYATEFGIGIAQFVSMGNKPDVSGNDLLLQWEHDPQIGVILMYVENFGNPRRFLEVASRITRKKPIIVVKAGRSAVGARAASSHTGALAASESAVDALVQQAGVLRAGSIEELFDMAMAFSVLRPPRSRRTAVVGNSGGPGVLAADALEERGLDLVEFTPATVGRLQPLFPAEASIRNPLDMIASANPAGYRIALDAVLADDRVDAAVAIFTPPLGVDSSEVANAIGSVAQAHPDKPVLAVLMGRERLPEARRELQRAGVPAYIFPESAARALGALARYGEMSARRGVTSALPALPPAARRRTDEIIARARRERRLKLTERDAFAVIEAYGVPIIESAVAASADDAVRAAESIGYPVALKVVSQRVVHKSDVGGVRLGIHDATDVRAAYASILTRVRDAVPGARIDGVLVQRQSEAGRELIVGVTRSAGFGGMVMVGLGGTYVEVLRDVAFRIAPIGMEDAREMLLSLRGAAILGAVRGQAAVPIERIQDILVRVSMIASGHPDIAELDINPLTVGPEGGIALDARVMLTAEE
ncbi:MAG TPA: acetate--CoA ligase family protein [Gemmatimonadaceae bacterium]|nr:acetate--CoA ligase family protein [Gemmatimonadaceae bacterium]